MKHNKRNPKPAPPAAADKWRFEAVFGLLILAVIGMGFRLGWLIYHTDPQIAERITRQQRRVFPLPGRPGSILARTSQRYVPLASSRQLPMCFADPSLIDESKLAGLAVRVAEAIQADPQEIAQAIRSRRDKRYVCLKRKLTEEQALAVRKLGLRAVGVEYEWCREYPNEQLAAAVVGFRRSDGVAGGGLELTQDNYLAALAGRSVTLTDAARRPIWQLTSESRAPQDGANVLLCLDAVIQGYLEQAVAASVEKHEAKWATGIVVDPHTGKILAMCSLPTFNPNRPGEVEAGWRTNLAISTPYEPGSVFKPIIAAAAVDSGMIDYSTQIFCENGTYRPPRGGRITDHGESYGYLTVAEGLIHSSNICLAKIGGMLGNENIHRIVKHFGFGERTGVELGGESPGIVRPLKKWGTYSTPRVPMGQEISATALQLTMAFSSLANGGLLMRPWLVEQVVDSDGRTVYQGRPQLVRRVLSAQTARRTLGVLQHVAELGPNSKVRMDRWTSWGKTGTAQIAGPGGYVERAYTGSFIGGAPVDRSRVVCLISVYWPNYSKGHFGNTVAAPYVRQVLEQTLDYLNVPSDKNTQETWSR